MTLYNLLGHSVVSRRKRIPPMEVIEKNKNEPTANVAGKLCGPIRPALDLKLAAATVAALDTSDDSKRGKTVCRDVLLLLAEFDFRVSIDFHCIALGVNSSL